MGRHRPKEDEFPLLRAMNLKAVHIRGDGNCLFHALSDQIYGHQNNHQQIRSRVIDYMRENAAYFREFIAVQPGGGRRRNPKRKNVAMYTSTTSSAGPTQAEMDRVFESHLQAMAQGGEYGDNLEISAFANTFGIDVMIYQAEFAMMTKAQPNDGSKKPVAHIAYHKWEHYSSVRNIDGPDTGLPEISPRSLSPEEEAKSQAAAAKAPNVQSWMVKAVTNSLPYPADQEIVRKTIEDCKGSIKTATSLLMDAEDRASTSSQQGGSSSNERDPDSDNEEFSGPSKKQDRRMSRASKAAQKEKTENEHRDAASQTKSPAKTEPATVESVSPTIELPVRQVKKPMLRLVSFKPKKQEEDEWATPSDDDHDGDFQPDGFEVEDEAASEYSGTSRSQSRGAEPTTGKTYIRLVSNHTKTYQRQSDPKPRRTTVREKIEQKSVAHKAIRKETKYRSSSSTRKLEVTSTNVGKIGPLLDYSIKTLCI